MKSNRFFYPFLSLAIAFGMISCSDADSKKSDSGTSADGIASMGFSFDMKNAKKYFKIQNPDGEDDYTLTLEASVQWPEEIGSYDIKHLQDSIITLVAGHRMASINDAMLAYVTNAADYGLGEKITEVDSVPSEPAFNTAFYAQTNISVSEITDELISFNCMFDQYMGGAHNMTGEYPFTYDFKTGSFITLKWLFADPQSPQLLGIITSAVAEAKDLTVDELRQSMLVDEIGVPEAVCIQDGLIVFHYNPYSVLPYSFGAIDATVSPYMIQDMLTPAAKALLVSE